ncbi:MAG: phage tail protein [Candidatus Latescibacterota bacterium]
MRYSIDVLDRTKTRVAELTGLTVARLSERVNAPALLSVQTVDEKKWGYIEPGVSFLRIRDGAESAGNMFRVREVRKERERERPCLSVVARHILGDAAEEVFAAAQDCVNYTPGQLAALVLGYSSFGIGTVEFIEPVPFVRFEYEPALDCLLRICALTGGELSLDEDAGEVSLLQRFGADNGAVFRYGFNLKSAARTVNVSRLANRVYGVGGGNPLLDLREASEGGGLPHVEDVESITRWGLREAVCHEPTLEAVINLVTTPALDGTYTDGLCQGWTNLGATVSRNEDPARFLYGCASQRVQTSAPGQGIAQNVTVTPGKVYSLLAHFFLVSGAVRVQAEDGTAIYRRAEAVTGTGFAAVRIEGWKAISSAVMVKVVQEGGGTAEFCVDSVQIAEGARVKPFTVGKSADTLRSRTLEYLNAHKEPEITYEIDLVDRSGDPGMERTALRFGLGDTVTVIDPTLDLRVSTRVMEREADLLRPSRVRVRLDTPSRGLSDILASLREAQAEGVKHTRAALAESSTAAEAGSLRLGFSGQTLRFSGAITATGWNSFSWSAGTLRVGNAWFSLDGGSVSGLSGSSALFFYFDRTAPASFGYTLSPAQAEEEDRILVFAVTTTVSPAPCVIHPLGMIRG